MPTPAGHRPYTQEAQVKTCDKCGKEYEDSLDGCPKCAKRKKQYIIAAVIAVVVISAVLKMLFLF